MYNLYSLSFLVSNHNDNLHTNTMTRTIMTTKNEDEDEDEDEDVDTIDFFVLARCHGGTDGGMDGPTDRYSGL